jgi:3-methyladenine DNA glycosylase/8-oxoguanine DNA glycosylase
MRRVVRAVVSQRGRTALMRADPVLGRLMTRVGRYGLVVEPLTSTFEALARSIVWQQLTGRAAQTIWNRLCALDGGDGTQPPSPTTTLALDEAMLRGAGLSRAKVLALKDLAARAKDGSLPDVADLAALDDDEVIAQLTAVRGVGPWSVQMLLMFRLGRRDVFPVDDYGIQQGFQRVFRGEATKARMLARAERWRPHRTMASWYLWRANELP